MFNLDLDKLMQDPNFISGIGLLGASSERSKPLLTAYQMLRQHEQSKREHAESQSMQEYRRAQMEVARSTAEKYGQQNELAKAKLEQGAKNREMFMQLMQGQGGIPGLQQQQQPAEPMMPPPEPTGKYGTPKRILQNLKQVESSGNPFAIGPDIGGGVRAQGAFQFLPSTRKMLKEQGIDFDPFNPQQAEDAADWYIQSLVKKHGGDYQKALADYGGFKTKDSSKYVSKVMSGSPESVVKQHSQNQEQQALKQKNQQTFGYVPEFTLDDDEIKITLKPNYEQQKIGIQKDELAIKQTAEQRHAQELEIKRQAEAREGRTVGLRERETVAEERRTQAGVAEKDLEMKEKKAKALNSIQAIDSSFSRMSSVAGELKNHPGLKYITGRVYSAIDPRLLGKDAMDAAAILENLKAQAFVQGTLSLRNASPTGAGVGNQSNQEGEKLQEAIAMLTRAQTTEQMQTALDNLQKLSAGTKERMWGAYEQGFGKAERPTQSADPAKPRSVTRTGKTKDGRKVIQYSDGSIEYAN
jgi:hypothetical protein